MKKFFTIISTSMQMEFAYRFNFIMWRVRNVLRIFLVFFLWDAIYSSPDRILFGYSRAQMMTYVFGLIIVNAFVRSNRSGDVAGDISSGRINVDLLRPVNYFYYWFTRDISSKILNLGFAAIEAALLFFLLKPEFFLQTNPFTWIFFILALFLAMIVYFLITFLTSALPLWHPEIAWGARFLFGMIFVEFLSGALFPLDVLPQSIQSVINWTPFPYLIFFPIQVYLGKVGGIVLLKGLLVTGAWVGILWVTLNRIWEKGLKTYQAYGM